MLTVDELRELRGDKCEYCKINQGTQRHHVFFRQRKGHPEYDHPFNLMLCCVVCHIQKALLDSYEVACLFWKVQVTRYGQAFINWYDGVPMKSVKERYE